MDICSPSEDGEIADDVHLKDIVNVLCDCPLSRLYENNNDYLEKTLKIAQKHGVASLFCYHLRHSADWEKLTSHHQDICLRRLKLEAGLDAIRDVEESAVLQALVSAQIPMLLLKGAALGRSHYPESYLRTRSDIDLLILPRDIKNVSEILSGLGFTCGGPLYKNHQFTFTKIGLNDFTVNFDVHWRLTNLPEYARIFDFEELLKASSTIERSNNIPSLSEYHALILACIHLVSNPQHIQNRLIWLHDIHLLLTKMSSINLQRFIALAGERGVLEICREVICTTQRHFNTELSPELTELLPEELSLPEQSRYRKSYLALIVDDLRILPDMLSRSKLLRELILPPADEILMKYDCANKAMLPFLYARYYLQGAMRRFTLR